MGKFKVGDRVIGNKSASGRYSITKTGYVGAVTKVYDGGIQLNDRFNVDPKYFDLDTPRHNKIVITTDGKTTLARLYEGDDVIKSAEAICSPADTFDFNIGAKLAYDRLMMPKKSELVKLYCVEDLEGTFTSGNVYEVVNEKIRYDDGGFGYFPSDFQRAKKEFPNLASCLVPLVSRPAEVGEWIYLKESSFSTATLPINKVYKVEKHYPTSLCGVKGNRIAAGDGLWAVLSDEYLVLDGYKPEPEYFSGKVVCVDANQYCHTVGKAYTVVDGFLIDDSGMKVPVKTGPVTSVDDLNSRSACKFIEFLGE